MYMNIIDKLFDRLENECSNRQNLTLLEIRIILDAERDFSYVEDAAGYAEEVNGVLTEWLGRGLQNLLQRFESVERLVIVV